MFGSVDEFVRIVESVVVGQGQAVDEEWQRFCVLYREWQRRREAGLIDRDPTLNDAAYILCIKTDEFFSRLAIAMQGLFTKIGQMKLLAGVPRAVDLTLAAMEDLKDGFNDRQVVLKAAGVIADKPGVVVNNTNNLGVRVNLKQELAGPLGQFRETIEGVDEVVRDEAMVRALGPANAENIVDVPIETIENAPVA